MSVNEKGRNAMSKREKRLSVATNAAATAMFGVGCGEYVPLTEEQIEAARAIALRVLDHIDRYDARLNGSSE